MIATLTAASQIRMSSTMERASILNSNSAGGPLPFIPRRSTSRSHNGSSSATIDSTPIAVTPIRVVIEKPSPPNKNGHSSTSVIDDSDSSSSSISTVTRAKRHAARITTLCPPEHSTPAVYNTKAEPDRRISLPEASGQSVGENTGNTGSPCLLNPRPLIYKPGIPLRIDVEALKSRSLSDSHVDNSAVPLQVTSSNVPTCPAKGVIRKKSGQLVKSSLKSAKSSARGCLTVVTRGGTSKSEPTTPKAVHFDAQLEHVKLFLAEQKPLAVSRDGSPTDDTSGTESDFPSFIYGDADDRRFRQNLLMNVINMPAKVNLNADVALEELKLSTDMLSITGSARLRNIAFHKQLAVRFTFDSWQTTSEVGGKYVESINPSFDRFTFSIRLSDLLARIEGKHLILALRYCVAGREIWDNNGYQNYHATFTRNSPKVEKIKSDQHIASSDIADLKSRLEKVVRSRDSGESRPPRRSASPPDSHDEMPLELKTSGSLASRYDLGSSLKSPWKHVPPSLPPHGRTASHPTFTPANSIPWPEKSMSLVLPRSRDDLGSPRDLDKDHVRLVPYAATDVEDKPFAVPTRERVGRNHQRGYFDINVMHSSNVRRTPPGTPRARSADDSTPLAGTRSISFPPADGARSPYMSGLGLTVSSGVSVSPAEIGDSEDSTPTLFSSSGSSRSSTPSPTESFAVSHLSELFSRHPQVSSPVDYHQFLDKFCFYTGSDSPIPRSVSATSIDEFFASQSPRLHGLSHLFGTSLGSSSDDSIAYKSGSSTPTAHGLSDSRSATPVLA